MNYKNFDRHEAFTPEMMDLLGTTIREVEDFCLVNNNSMINELTNMLFGLYDGYLYDDLLECAINYNLGDSTLNKIKGLIKSIEMYISLFEQSKA